MRSALSTLALGVAACLAACGQRAQEQAADQDMTIEDNFAAGELPANAEIETLPPDESSGTSTADLNSGVDNDNLSNGH